MTWQQASPLAAAAGAVGSFFTAQQQAKKDAAEAARQATLDRQTAATSAADIAYKSAQTTGLANTEARAKREDVNKGYGLTPPAMPTPKPGQHLSNRQIENYWSDVGTYYARNGAMEAAKNAVGNATAYGALADKDEAAQTALRKEANTEIETQARIHHWTAQEKQAAIDAANRLSIAAGHDATSMANTQAHVGAMIQAANIAADSRIHAAHISAAGALQRERESQAAATGRTRLTQAGATGREEDVQGHEDKRAVGKAGTKFRSIPTTTQALMVRQMKEAINAGADPKAVFAHAAQLHGIPPDEAEGIYDDGSSADE